MPDRQAPVERTIDGEGDTPMRLPRRPNPRAKEAASTAPSASPTRNLTSAPFGRSTRPGGEHTSWPVRDYP